MGTAPVLEPTERRQSERPTQPKRTVERMIAWRVRTPAPYGLPAFDAWPRLSFDGCAADGVRRTPIVNQSQSSRPTEVGWRSLEGCVALPDHSLPLACPPEPR